jgi:hypothetical protein
VLTGLTHFDRREYSAGLQTWIGMDPLYTSTNWYVAFGNNPVNYVDPMGLWKIQRTNGARATAIAEANDTIRKLGVKIGLHPGEFKEWLTMPGGKVSIKGFPFVGIDGLGLDDVICPGQKVEIPNTVITMWLGDARAFGRGAVDWDTDVLYLQKLGFKTIEFNHNTQKMTTAAVLSAFESGAKNRELHGMMVWGHGYTYTNDPKNPGGIQNGGKAAKKGGSFSVDYNDILSKMSYKLGLVILNVCYGERGEVLRANSANTNSKFYGISGTLVPGAHSVDPDEVIKPGEQGTRAK